MKIIVFIMKHNYIYISLYNIYNCKYKWETVIVPTKT